MTKRRRIALLSASALAGVGLTVGGLSAANAGEARTIKVKWTAPGGMAYVGKICTKASAENADGSYPGDQPSFNEQCNNSVTVGEKDNITIPVPAEYGDRKVYVDIAAEAIAGDFISDRPDFSVPANSGDHTVCLKWSGASMGDGPDGPKLDKVPLEQCE